MPFLISQALMSLIVLVIAIGLCAALRRSSAAHRHLIWAAAFSSLLIIPPLASLIPASDRTAPLQVVMVTSANVQTAPSQDPAETAISRITLLGWTWATGTGYLLLELVIGLAVCAHRRRRATPFSADLIEPSTADVRISRAVSVPETFGLVKPAILLPEQARNWMADRLQVALLHELVHIKRGDWAIHLMARFAASLFWLNPLCWYALARLRQEAELACDDGVLYAGVRQSDYAHQLIEIAKGLNARPSAFVVPMARPSQIEDRIRAILNPVRNRRRLTVKDRLFTLIPAALIAVAASLITAPAQTGNASISGTVRDPSGAVVPEATVVLSNGKNQETIRTNEVGTFEFSDIAEGKYSVQVLKPGFKAFEIPAVAISKGGQLDVRLDIGRISEKVTVVAQGQRRAQQQATSSVPQRVRVGGNMQPAKLLSRVPPQYPPHLAAQGIEGTVLLQTVIGTNGQVLNAEAKNWKIDPDFVKAAIDAVKQWRYEPTLLNGVPVEVVAAITVDFRLNP